MEGNHQAVNAAGGHEAYHFMQRSLKEHNNSRRWKTWNHKVDHHCSASAILRIKDSPTRANRTNALIKIQHKREGLVRAKESFFVILLLALVSSVCALNGKAVAVVSNFLSPVDGSQASDVSRMIVVTTQSVGNVTSNVKTDTILRGRMFYPMWSFDGTRIAFYKDGAGVCVVNADGSNLRTVARTVDWGREDWFYNLSWPGIDGGKWIYYHKTCNSGCFRNGSGEIWKVNVDDTAQKSMICDYTKSNVQIEPGIPWFGRFQLSADAKYAAIHAGGVPSLAVWGYRNGCIPHEFPPKVIPGTTQIDPGLTEPACDNCGGYRGACNTGLSTSGNIFFHFDGAHTVIYANYWNHAAKTINGRYDIGTGPWGSLDMDKDLDPWISTGAGMGDCLVWPKGSSNSDRVVSVLTGWKYGDMYSPTGSNLIIADWKDKKAAMVTNNPRPNLFKNAQGQEMSWVVEGDRYWVAEPGDFWVAGGPAGCYEAIDGSWVNVQTGQVTNVDNRSRNVNGTRTAIRPVAIYTLTGTRLGSYDAEKFTQRSSLPLHMGTYVIGDCQGAARLLTAVK